MIGGIRLLAAAVTIAAVAMPRIGCAAPVSRLTITVSPAAPGASGDIPYVDVLVVAANMHVAAGRPLIRLPLVSSNVATIADSLQNLRVTDSRGAVALTARDDPPAEQMPFRRWHADREASGTVTIRYRAPITNALNPRGAAPPLELRTEDGGFSGDASTFLVLPDSDRVYRIALTWNLAALGPKALGLSTLGSGNTGDAADAADAGSVANADNTGTAGHTMPTPAAELRLDAVYGNGLYFMGGLVHTYPAPLPGSGFMSAWQGSPPFDARALMHWTQSLYGSYLRFFHSAPGRPYEVFLRRNLVNAGGGVEVGRSFVGTFDRQTKAEDLELTLAHEMVHTFVGGLDSPQGLASSWYAEGLAVYYERVLPWRVGHLSTADFLTDLNKTAARYYTDLLSDTPNSQIPMRFWADTRVRVLPYDRGSLYFAQLNAELRHASHGKRSLDDLVLQMIGRRRQGVHVDEKAWVALLRETLGAGGVAQFQAMMDGRLIVPGSDAFGRCFARTTTPLRRYQLGFDSQVLAEPQRIVRGLVPGAAAARAGLKDGDRIVKPVPQDAIQADQHARLTLLIERSGRTFPIAYLPRGETVAAYQWRRRPGVPDRECAL